ncbi:MAG TPA: ABC transporter permease [Cyclobacteriaceae bacterium]|nr:ABC transporter permease [Cyclobacteriaceae bacterium]
MSIYRNYLKISIRNIFKQKLYSGINIGGLTAGLTIFILIMLYVNHEYSYDRFYKDGDRVYRVYQQQIGNDADVGNIFGVTPPQLASVMRDEMTGLEATTTVDAAEGLLSNGDEHFWEPGLFGDEQFFEVFPLPFIKGNREKAFADPTSVVLTESLARKIFGDKDPIGLQLKYHSEDLFTVTGVVGDAPANSSFDYTFIMHIHANGWYANRIKIPKWNGSSFHTFIKLTEGVQTAEIESKLPDLQMKYYDPVSYDNYPYKDRYILGKLSDLHLGGPVMNADIGIKGNARSVNLMMIVALIILVLACVNYMNLAIARSIKRAKEVGLRKSVGALKRQIAAQFLSESLLFAFLSLLMAVGMVYILLPSFGDLMERRIPLEYLHNPVLLPGLPILVIIIGVISGSYPAFVMSSLMPVNVLKGKIDKTMAGRNLQRWLLVGQYCISIVLVVCSVGIYLQNEYMQQKNLGFDRDHVLTFRSRDYRLLEHREALKAEWSQNPNIISSTLLSHLPIQIGSSYVINDEPGTPTTDDVHVFEMRVDYDFLKVFNMNLIAGRYFSETFPNDSKDSYVINETAVKALGWTPEEAIGKQIWDEQPVTIIGVIKDFHMHSLHQAIRPLVIKLRDEWKSYFCLKISPDNIQETIAYIDQTVKKRSPYPFSYEFLDDSFDRMYKSEANLGKIFGWFTVLSILIASLGLFGLAAFMSAQRTKEIGVRKVLGASIQNIVVLLTKDFLVMVVIAFVLAIPIAWYGMSQWLQTFAYRIDIQWWMFGGAGLLAILIAAFSVGYLSLKASMANPVDSLKSE